MGRTFYHYILNAYVSEILRGMLKLVPTSDRTMFSVTCVCGRNDEENEEEDEGEEEERIMVFLGQLLKTSVLLLAFRKIRQY